ncbi:unnamed protein product [Leptosia nina]|uniref:C2H2-type domain-containing protein n=1 Tax=Leptosia nina TaxID=320188 RepID=A0AAV1JNJ2_9NEOP
MTRSKKVSEEATATTLAILKPVTKIPHTPPEESKENKKAAVQEKEPFEAREPKVEGSYHIVPRASSQLPCAQYKTDKGYKCPNCQRCYNARKNLVRHVTLECGREPQYKCPYCAYSKHRRNELKKHIEKKHPNCMQLASSPVTVK